MGNDNDNVTSDIYRLEEGKLVKTNNYAKFRNYPFHEGTFKLCFEGKIYKLTNNSYIRDETECVVKVSKIKKVPHNIFIPEKDFKNIFYARKLSKIFNSLYHSSCPELIFNFPLISCIDKYGDTYSKKKIKELESFTIEPLLVDYRYSFVTSLSNHPLIEININSAKNLENIQDDGSDISIMTKFTLTLFRSDYFAQDKYYKIDEIISFFMHWNWAYSEGLTLITGIKGIKKDNYYELYEPTVHSINKEYGYRDLGYYGLIWFLLNHNHNNYCKDLPWIKEQNIFEIFNLKKEGILINFNSEVYKDNQEYYDNKYKEIKDSIFNKNICSATNQNTNRRKCIIF